MTAARLSTDHFVNREQRNQRVQENEPGRIAATRRSSSLHQRSWVDDVALVGRRKHRILAGKRPKMKTLKSFERDTH